MWRESAQKPMRGWLKSLRQLLSGQPKPAKLPPKTNSGCSANPGASLPTRNSYQETAKAALEAAKTYSSQLRKSSSAYASNLSKGLPTEIPKTSTIKGITEPANRAIKESLVSATAQATRITKEKVAIPAQNAWKKSAQKVSDSVTSASAHVATTASRIAQEQITQPSQKVLDRTSQSARNVLEKSAQRTSESMKTVASNAVSAATELAKSSQQTLMDELRSMRRDGMWWLWWWSLAAIAVYGVATTLPGELLREYNRSRQNKATTVSKDIQKNAISYQEDRNGVNDRRRLEEEEAASSKIILPAGLFYSEKDRIAQTEKGLSKPKTFPKLSWPVLGKDDDGSTNQREQPGSIFWPPFLQDKQNDNIPVAKESSRWNWPSWSSSSDRDQE